MTGADAPTEQSLEFQVATRALTRFRVGIDTGRLEVGMAEGLGQTADRRPFVDGVRRVRVPQPVHRSGWVDPRALCRGLDEVVHGALGQWLARPAARREYRVGCCRLAAAGDETLGDLRRDQHLAHLVAFA